MTQAAADALQERLVLFAVKIIDLAACLPKTTAGRHVAGQVLRPGTSPAPNYAEARGAESRARLRFASADKPSLKLRLAGRSLGEGRHLAAHYPKSSYGSGCAGYRPRQGESRVCWYSQRLDQDCTGHRLTTGK